MINLVDKKKNMWQHNIFHQLTARRVKWTPETIYSNIKEIIHHDSQKYITSEGWR